VEENVEETTEEETSASSSLKALKKQGSNALWQKKDIRQSIERHRKRRYTVACNLLVSSAEFLCLDDPNEAAKQLRPLLQALLTPPKKKTTPPQTKEEEESSSSSLVQSVLSGTTVRTITEGIAVEDPWTFKRGGDELLLQDDTLRTNMEEISPGAGFQCLSLMLFQLLLSGKEGYDARVRYPIKRLGVTIFIHNNTNNNTTLGDDYGDRLTRATRQFESLERMIADRILGLASKKQTSSSGSSDQESGSSKQGGGGPSRRDIVRGLKIGTAGVLAGTLLVVTGGMAAPGIAAGLGALGLASVGATFLALAGSTAVISIFGVASGSLAMYKMNRRTAGLTEFAFQQVVSAAGDTTGQKQEAELSRTVCISGWLRDSFDFHRPWGIAPFDPPLSDTLELLERFYSIHNPDLVPFAANILTRWEGEETRLWESLKEKYKEDPDHLFPLKSGPKFEGALGSEDVEVLDKLIVEVAALHDKNEKGHKSASASASDSKEGLASSVEKPSKPFAKFQAGGSKMGKNLAASGKKFGMGWGKKSKNSSDPSSSSTKESPTDSTTTTNTPPVTDGAGSAGDDLGEVAGSQGKYSKQFTQLATSGSKLMAGFGKKSAESDSSRGLLQNETYPLSASEFEQVPPPEQKDDNKDVAKTTKTPKHLATVWDYQANYGGELYIVKWESELMLDLCNSVADLAYEMASMAGKEVLKQTIAATLILAAAIPTAIYSAMNSLDSTWTLVIERSDAAGKELARSLLSNQAGRRPVTLVGFSFGARAIFSCLKELARYQEEWEERQETKGEEKADSSTTSSSSKKENPDSFEFDREPACVVEDVILMGAPIHLNLNAWKTCRQIVAGRLVNVYSRKDRILSYMFKYKHLSGGLKPVCGTCTVAVPGVESLDVTDIVPGHADYCLVSGEILKRIRHGQPLRLSYSHAIDEVALIAEVEQLALEEEKP
jgi:hypothetical protein